MGGGWFVMGGGCMPGTWKWPWSTRRWSMTGGWASWWCPAPRWVRERGRLEAAGRVRALVRQKETGTGSERYGPCLYVGTLPTGLAGRVKKCSKSASASSSSSSSSPVGVEGSIVTAPPHRRALGASSENLGIARETRVG